MLEKIRVRVLKCPPGRERDFPIGRVFDAEADDWSARLVGLECGMTWYCPLVGFKKGYLRLEEAECSIK